MLSNVPVRNHQDSDRPYPNHKIWLIAGPAPRYARDCDLSVENLNKVHTDGTRFRRFGWV